MQIIDILSEARLIGFSREHETENEKPVLNQCCAVCETHEIGMTMRMAKQLELNSVCVLCFGRISLPGITK